MKILKKLYKRFRNTRRKDITEIVHKIVRKEIAVESMLQKSLSSNQQLTCGSSYDNNITVSLTTFGKRINYVYLALESIAQQTIKPNNVVLWLCEKSFNQETLPITLKRLMKRGLTIKYCEDIGPHTKLIYALKEYKNDMIITIDDDHIYPIDIIEKLLGAYKKYPKHICCNVAREIKRDYKGDIIPYHKWEKLFENEYTSEQLLPLGIHGVLYFPGCFDSDVFDIQHMKKLCPNADDIWFKVMHHKNKVECVVTGGYTDIKKEYITLDSANMDALYVNNVKKDENVLQINQLMEHYNVSI